MIVEASGMPFCYDVAMTRWFVYIVKCRDGSLYTGIAIDVTVRIAKHNAGTGGKYTRSRCPVTLVWRERARTRGAALRREAEIKSWPRKEKLALVSRSNGTGRRRGERYGSRHR